MSNACTSQPVSWLLLERYNLGELSPQESGRVETHLGECPVCQQCMDSILEQAVRLPPLPVAKPRGAGLRWAFAGVGLVVAAVLALVLATHDWQKAAGIPSNRIAYKGGELAISLVRERGGQIQHQPLTFLAGDRFKLLVTCPPGEELPWEVAVFQDDEISFPYASGEALPCANRVPLPGAFQLTGSSVAVICLVTGDRPASLDQLPEESVCLEIEPVR